MTRRFCASWGGLRGRSSFAGATEGQDPAPSEVEEDLRFVYVFPMILRPEETASINAAFVPAWQAVAGTQKAKSAKYHLVRQTDHARLAGQLAEQFAIPGKPTVDADIVRGISLHDEGWADFDCGRTRLQATAACYSQANVALNEEGKPLSFLEIKAPDFLLAWCNSIACAEAVAPIAGLIVSGHFRRLGQFGVSLGTYSEDDSQQVSEFIAQEDLRWQRLMRQQGRSEKEVGYWTDVLQFCDLLSLYLCCGAQQSVEFPQRLGPTGETIRLQVQNAVHVFSPSPFVREAEFSLEAQPYPAEATGLRARLSWSIH